MSFAALMNQTCAIQSKTITKDKYGQPTASWSNVSGGSSVNCRVQPLSAPRRSTDFMQYAEASHKLYLATGSYSIDENYRIVVTGDQNYIVRFAKTDSSGDHWELMCIAETLIQ